MSIIMNTVMKNQNANVVVGAKANKNNKTSLVLEAAVVLKVVIKIKHQNPTKKRFHLPFATLMSNQ